MDEVNRGFLLNRDFLVSGGLDAMLLGLNPALRARLWTDAQREASLAAVLAARPPESVASGGIWLFCYGSLIWNPMIEVTARRRMTVTGWHRAFCLSTPGGRGTPEQPGLLLGLDEGGTCEGVSLFIPEALVVADLDVIWRREMLTGSYVPRWLEAVDQEGVAQPVLTFTIDREGPQYAQLDEAAAVARLATARGALGSCAEYLFRTQAALAEAGIGDPLIDGLAVKVRAALAL
jgi:cation transport protein ChaC